MAREHGDDAPATELEVCAVPGIYPCDGCEGREDPTFGTEITPGNGVCIGSDCADVSLWAHAADSNEATHSVIVPGAGNVAKSADEIRAFLRNPVPEGAQAGCVAGAAPAPAAKTDAEKAADAAEIERYKAQLARQGAAQKQRADRQSQDTLLNAIQNDEAWLDNRTGDYYLSQDDAVAGALKALGREHPQLTSYEAVQMVSLTGPRGQRIGPPVSSGPPRNPLPTSAERTKVKNTNRKNKTKKTKTTEFEVFDPDRDEIIAVYKTRRGAENRALKHASQGYHVREVPIRDRERTPLKRKSRTKKKIANVGYVVYNTVTSQVEASYKTRRGAEIRAQRENDKSRILTERGMESPGSFDIREVQLRHKTKTKSRRRRTKTKSRRRKTKSKSMRRKTKTKSRRRKTKSRRRKTKSRRRKTKSRRRKTKTKSRRRKTKSRRRKLKSRKRSRP